MKQLKHKKYKALMSDIDGTLILNNPHSTPTQKIIDAIKKADELVYVGVATSRPFHHAERIINILNLSAPCIVGGGSQIVDPKTKKVIWEKKLNEVQTTEILEKLENLEFKIELLDDEDNILKLKNKQKEHLQVWIPGHLPKEVDEIIKILSSIKTIAINKVPSYKKGEIAIVITNLNATKQQGILEVAKILNIKTKDFIGIGDGGNDFPLLMACGLKVAMGNAVPELKAIADYVAPSVEKDGVAKVIEKYLLNE